MKHPDATIIILSWHRSFMCTCALTWQRNSKKMERRNVWVWVCCSTSLWWGSRDTEWTLQLGRLPRINSADIWLDGDGEWRACKWRHISSHKRYSEIRQLQQTSTKLRGHQRTWFKLRRFETWMCWNCLRVLEGCWRMGAKPLDVNIPSNIKRVKIKIISHAAKSSASIWN